MLSSRICRAHWLGVFMGVCGLATAQASNTVTVTGTVTEAGSGAPIAGATVAAGRTFLALVPPPPREFDVLFDLTTTGADGFYTLQFDLNLPREIVFEAASPVHAPARSGGTPEVNCFFGCGGSGGEQTVSPSDVISGQDIVLQPGGFVSGTVTNAGTGEGLEDAIVSLPVESEFLGNIRTLYFSWHFWAITDADGAYRTPLALSPGKYFVRADPKEGENFVGSYRVRGSNSSYQTTALHPGTYTLKPFVSDAFVTTDEFTFTIGTETVQADVGVTENFIFGSRFEGN